MHLRDARSRLLFFLCLLSLTKVGFGQPPASKDTQTISFQQGVNQYAGTVDTEIWALAPHTILESNPNSSTDAGLITARAPGIFGAFMGMPR